MRASADNGGRAMLCLKLSGHAPKPASMTRRCYLLAAALAVILGLAVPMAQARSPESASRVLILRPKAANGADATHAALALTRKSFSNHISFAGRVQTVKQLRVDAPPNPWECAWIVWNYQDNAHFYYVALKPTGWEIGKRDPAYPGGQRFLASGSRKFPIGSWHDFIVNQSDNTIEVRVNGVAIASVADRERPYTAGRLGVYAEDSEVAIDDVTAPFEDDFEGYWPQTNKKDGSIMKNWIMPFLGFGYAAIASR
jgi:hypothetical protein